MKKLKSIFTFRKDLTSFTNNDDQNEYRFCEKEFDAEGRLVRMTYFSPDGSERLVEGWQYDDKGRLTEESSFQPEEETDEKVLYKYDDTGNCIERTEMFSGEVFNHTMNEYDAQNHKIRSAYLDDDGNESESETFEYSPGGQMTKHSHYDADGKNDWAVEMKYNESGKVIEETKHEFLEKKIEKTTYAYNEEGKNTGIETHNSRGQLIHMETYEYDEAGNLINTEMQSSQPYSQHTTRMAEYDELNRPVEVTIYDNLNKYLINKESTTYDENGQLATQELYELRAGQGMTKTHVELRFENEYEEED